MSLPQYLLHEGIHETHSVMDMRTHKSGIISGIVLSHDAQVRAETSKKV